MVDIRKLTLILALPKSQTLCNPGKAAGPDSTKAKDKSMTGDSLAEGDYGLFRGVIYKKQLPHNWNYAKLKVAHKTGDSQKRENYRPLSMLSIVSKIFEV